LEFGVVVGQVFQFGWANEGEVGWVEHEYGPLAFQGLFGQIDEFTILVSGCFEWFNLGIDQRHCSFLVGCESINASVRIFLPYAKLIVTIDLIRFDYRYSIRIAILSLFRENWIAAGAMARCNEKTYY
jgi:hypothetical protein